MEMSGEYELAGIETIARGVAVAGGRLLVCRAKGAVTCYLPGGHIEFGETGREALVREVREELGLTATTGRFLGVVENSFEQQGRPHAEINLVYELDVKGLSPASGIVPACEDWIEFEWVALSDLGSAHLLPAQFARLATDPAAFFSV